MSMMNRQMPGRKNQHRSNKMRLNWIFMLCAVLIFFPRISLRFPSVRVPCRAEPVPRHPCMPFVIIYLHTQTRTHPSISMHVFIYFVCLMVCCVSLSLTCLVGRLHSCFSFAFFLLLHVFVPDLIGCQEESPNSTWQNVWVENKEEPVNITTHARIHIFTYAEPKRKLLPGTVFL